MIMYTDLIVGQRYIYDWLRSSRHLILFPYVLLVPIDYHMCDQQWPVPIWLWLELIWDFFLALCLYQFLWKMSTSTRTRSQYQSKCEHLNWGACFPLTMYQIWDLMYYYLSSVIWSPFFESMIKQCCKWIRTPSIFSCSTS